MNFNQSPQERALSINAIAAFQVYVQLNHYRGNTQPTLIIESIITK